MTVKNIGLFFCSLLFVLACKHDIKNAKKDELNPETKEKLEKIREQFKEQKHKKNLPDGRTADTEVNRTFPKSSSLLERGVIEKIFDLAPGSVKITADEYKEQTGFSRTVWNWHDKSDSFHKLTVVMNTNPSPDDTQGWARMSLDHFLQSGIPQPDGSTVTFKAFEQNGYRFLSAGQGPMLKWFYKDDIAFTFLGLGPAFTDQRLIDAALEMIKKLKAYRKE